MHPRVKSLSPWLTALISAIIICSFCNLANAAAGIKVPVATEAIGAGRAADATAAPQPTTLLYLNFALNSAPQDQIESYVNTLSDPTSSNYHKWLTPAQFGAKFGASQSDIDAVTSYLKSIGFTNITVRPDGLMIAVTATAAQVEGALGVTIQGYDRPTEQVSAGLGQSYYAPTQNPTVDVSVASKISGIFGLSNYVQSLPQSHTVKMDAEPLIGPGGTLQPADLSSAYKTDTLHSFGLYGQGETIGIYSPTLFDANDVILFENAFNITGATVNLINVDGGASDYGGEVEACLDIETILGQAPEATINVYQGPNDGGFDIFSAIEADRPDIVSSSWGSSEDLYSGSYVEAIEPLLMALSAEGVTVLNASGDSGAYTDHSGTTIGPLFPASSPFVTAVGGTELSPLISGNWNGEIGWTLNDGSISADDGLNWGSGGGLSLFFKQPAWQTGPGVANANTNGMRQVPDVAALASTPFYEIYAGGGEISEGGTSAATPLWSSSLSLIEQNLQTRLGNINPELYQFGTHNASVFHDITSGNNGVYYCTPGWDFVTGWGSADFSRLFTALGGVPTTISSFTPAIGPIGSSVTLTGTALENATSVSFAGVSSTVITNNSSGGLVVKVPRGALSGALTVVTPQGTATSGANLFTVVPTPIISPNGGTYANAHSVGLSDSLMGTQIYYTTDGSTPTASSTQYSSPISISTSEVLNVIAISSVQSGSITSAEASATFIIGGTVPTPAINPNGGTFFTSTSVALSDIFAGATIYYTADGTSPTTNSTVYTGPITVTQSETVNAIGVYSGFSNSGVASATFTNEPTVPTPIISPSGGAFVTGQSVALYDSLNTAQIYYTTDGTTPSSASTLYSAPFTVSASSTVKAIGIELDYANSSVASTGFVIGATVPQPTISPNGGTFTAVQTATLADVQNGVAIYYTTDGTVPTTMSTPYHIGVPINILGTETINAIGVANGYLTSPSTTALFTINLPPPAPTINPTSSTFSGTGQVAVSDSQTGNTIYYTTDGTTPTTGSNIYSGPITVLASETLTAIAVSPANQTSPTASAVFTVLPMTTAPTITPNGGTYDTVQTVTIADTQSGAVIYYTLDGSTPTSSSAKYIGAFNVSGSATVTAIAIAPNYGTSAEASASFLVNLIVPTPTISPAGGSFTTVQTVTLADSLSSAAIYYSTNATSSSPSWQQYSAPISISSTETLTVFASATGYTSSSQTSATFTVTLPTLASFSSGLQLISLPYTYTGVTLDSLFGYSGVKLAVWNQASLSYAVTPTAPANSIVTGQGYWVRFPQAVSITQPGTPAPTTQPFVIKLQAGWNMIGDPFTTTIPLSSLTFAGGSMTYAQASSAANSLIGASFYAYSQSSNNYVVSASLAPEKGYWVYASSATDMDVPAPSGG